MQREPERDLVASWQQGSLASAREIVSMAQSEALNVAWLLTGERDEAIALAETGLLALLAQSRSGDPDFDARVRLLILLGQTYLRGEHKPRVQRDAGGLLLSPGPARFQVDNRRSLILAALGRLADHERVTLVLLDFSGLEPAELATLSERRAEPAIAPLETARQRVRQSIDVPTGDPLRPALVEATFDAPRVNLWARLEEPVTAIEQRARNQSRIMSLAILSLIAVVVLGGVLALFAGDLRGETGGDSGVAAQPTAEQTSLPAGPTVGQSIRLEPTPTPEPTAYPPATVPGWLLIETWQQNQGDTQRTLTVYDPAIERTRRLPSNEPLVLARGADQVRFSPDGYQMVLFREQENADGMRYFLTSFSTDSIGRQWETEVLRIARDERIVPDPFGSGSHVPVRMTAAITGNRVYAATLTTDTEPRLEIQSFFRRNGMPRGSVEIALPLQTPDSRVFRGNILLHAPPGSDSLYLIVESFGDAAEQWRASLMTFDRDDLTLVSERTISADPNQGYWLWSSRMTPDGSALFGIHERRAGNQVQAQFLEFETATISTVALPFATVANRLEAVLTVPSHDGTRAYVLDREGLNVAEIDLIGRRVERVFPLDREEIAGQLRLGPDDRLFGYGSALSSDGARLYIASWDHDGSRDTRRQQGVWVIDTTLWKLTGFIPVGGLIDGIFLSPAENAIYAQVWPEPYGSTRRELVRIITDDAPAVVERLTLPEHGSDYAATRSPAHHYHAQFGRSPAIDNVPLTDAASFSTLPWVEVRTSPTVVSAGQSATLVVSVQNPAGGEPLADALPDVRFDPDSSASAAVHLDGQQRQIVFLSTVRPGIYQGTVSLPAVGTWTVDVTMTDSAGVTSQRHATGRIDVTPAFVGSDGRAYAFRITTIPDIPYAGEETVVQLELIDVETGQPLPEDVTVEITQGMSAGVEPAELPDRIDVPLMHDAPGFLTARLSKVRNGVYQGTVSFWASGAWHASIQIRPEGLPQITIPANAVMVSGS